MKKHSFSVSKVTTVLSGFGRQAFIATSVFDPSMSAPCIIVKHTSDSICIFWTKYRSYINNIGCSRRFIYSNWSRNRVTTRTFIKNYAVHTHPLNYVCVHMSADHLRRCSNGDNYSRSALPRQPRSELRICKLYLIGFCRRWWEPLLRFSNITSISRGTHMSDTTSGNAMYFRSSAE